MPLAWEFVFKFPGTMGAVKAIRIASLGAEESNNVQFRRCYPSVRVEHAVARFYRKLRPRTTRGACSLLDDNKDIADVLCALLAALGHIPCACHSASDCFRCLATFRPHVILLDLCLPGCDGFEICRRIHREVYHAEIWR